MVDPPNVPDRPGEPGLAWTLFGSTRLRRFPTMKHFARLVRFAWPYRVRFGLSLGCAVMVALLWSANISAVYPLLKILFYSENCQKWVAERIADKQDEVQILDARVDEIARIRGLGDPLGLAMRDHFSRRHVEWEACERRVAELEREFDGIALKGKDRRANPDQLKLESRRRERGVARARL